LSVIEDQGSRVREALGRIIARGQPYALVDFPDHGNVGDSAIWLGEIEALLSVAGRQPSYVCSNQEDYDPAELRARLPQGPILIHGGGNFGDVWPHHQRFREQILKDFPDRMVVQLSQSISFSSESDIERTAAVIAAHGNFRLMVRDRKSLEFATSKFSCATELVPDFALGLGPLERTRAWQDSAICLLRTDHEVSGQDYDQLHRQQDFPVADWLKDDRQSLRRVNAYARIVSALRFEGAAPKKVRYFNARAASRVRRGRDLLSSGKLVITDRLHAHILSTLMGIENVVLDNSYGKISGYIDAWMSSVDIVHVVDSPAAALETARELIAR
jgi:pyruvyl transferase EpsO